MKISYSLCWYGVTAPGLLEARVRLYVDGRALEERSIVGVPADYPLPVSVPVEQQCATITDPALQAAALAVGQTTWDETHLEAALAVFLGAPVTYEAPPELVAREFAERAAAAERAVQAEPPSLDQQLAEVEAQANDLRAQIAAATTAPAAPAGS